MYAQYQSYQQQQPTTTFSSSQQIPLKTTTPQRNQVEHYTKCYHGWKAHGDQCQHQLSLLPASDVQGRNEAQRRIDWAKYYADLSSRAAHHFYQNPNATRTPFDLPPDPPQTTLQSQAANHSPLPQQQPQPQPQQPQEPTKKEGAGTTGTLAAYIRTCLDRCPTPELRKQVQAQIEVKIAAAIQNGSFPTKNWASEPLIPVPGSPSASSQHFASFEVKAPKAKKQSKKRIANELSQNDSYYGNAGGSTNPSASPAASSNDSYYGYYGTSATAASPPSASKNSYYGHYGGSTTPDPSPATDTSYYGPSTSSHNSTNSNSDFIPLQRKSKKAKKQKQDLKGFEASSKVLAKRANRFSGPGGIQDVTNTATMISNDGHDKYMGKKMIGGSTEALDENDFVRMTVKGTCTTLEKEYLRLTAPPRPELVRPKHILEQHLKNLKLQYPRKNRKEYLWFCSQLKAIRQDCTVQRIGDGFAVDVYETHARIALKEGDLNEYNQCQTQLKELYHDNSSVPNQEEFIAYRLLYYVVLSCNDQYDGGSADMFNIMLSLTNEQRHHPAIAHALKVREALANGDYSSFFRLHKSTPNVGVQLTKLIAPTMRLRGLRRMAKAYRPTLEVEFCTQQLGFDSVEEGKEWLIRFGCVVDGSNILTKDSVIQEPEETKKNSLI
eukprot:scaffold2195_cov132-Cylindrotheca_fusiformis.AAC.17